ncbi:MAG: queuosine salvage family protein, partial [Phycisphaerae bacterium]|nr:queuosine salvage family protein [Phycisphaerae bacterium]
LAISGLKLPEVPEADTPRVLFEERIALLRQFGQVLDGLFEEFLRRRISAGWEQETAAIRNWIGARHQGQARRQLATV